MSHLAGVQAQEPFVGLWSHLHAFDPTDLDALVVDRRVVRAHLMRCTVHLVIADDMLAWRARHDVARWPPRDRAPAPSSRSRAWSRSPRLRRADCAAVADEGASMASLVSDGESDRVAVA